MGSTTAGGGHGHLPIVHGIHSSHILGFAPHAYVLKWEVIMTEQEVSGEGR